MPDLFWRYVGAALTAGGILLGLGRYVGDLERRLLVLESQQQYLHGKFTLPQQRSFDP